MIVCSGPGAVESGWFANRQDGSGHHRRTVGECSRFSPQSLWLNSEGATGCREGCGVWDWLLVVDGEQQGLRAPRGAVVAEADVKVVAAVSPS